MQPQKLRRHLVDELGIEPAELTRAVHRQLLEQDPQLSPPAPGPPTNLPRRATPFVNRVGEIAQLTAAVRDAPVVTLTGVGGVGKSRLALEVAARALPEFPDGVWLAELAPLPHDGPVGQAVAAALGVRQRQGATVEESVVDYLRMRRLLVVLDNCEHVLAAMSTRSCRRARCRATSYGSSASIAARMRSWATVICTCSSSRTWVISFRAPGVGGMARPATRTSRGSGSASARTRPSERTTNQWPGSWA